MRYDRKLYEHNGRSVTYKRRTKDEPTGRFGGGWQWEVGVQVAPGTVIVNLLVSSVRIDYRRKP